MKNVVHLLIRLRFNIDFTHQIRTYPNSETEGKKENQGKTEKWGNERNTNVIQILEVPKNTLTV